MSHTYLTTEGLQLHKNLLIVPSFVQFTGMQWLTEWELGTLKLGQCPSSPIYQTWIWNLCDRDFLSLLSAKGTLYLVGLKLKRINEIKKGSKNGWQRTMHTVQLNTRQPCFSFL